MDKGVIYRILKSANPRLDSKVAHFMSGCVWDDVRKWHKAEMKAAEEKRKVSAEVDPMIQKFLDNPMSKDEEARTLRAILHAGIAQGTIPAPLLDKLDKIIGVSGGEEEGISVVDFSEAFPDLAEAVRICTHQAED